MEGSKTEGGKRSKNFTDFDKNLLLDIVKHYQHIVDNIKTDATNVKIKNETWDLITKQYNYYNQSGSRLPKQLHALYYNIKKINKKRGITHQQFLNTPRPSVLPAFAAMPILHEFEVKEESVDPSEEIKYDSNSESMEDDTMEFNNSNEDELDFPQPITPKTASFFQEESEVSFIKSITPSENLSVANKVSAQQSGFSSSSQTQPVESTVERKSNIQILTKTITDRKKKKDLYDEEIHAKKKQLLDIELEITKFEREKRKSILEKEEHMKEIMLENLRYDQIIKQKEHDIKLKELKLRERELEKLLSDEV